MADSDKHEQLRKAIQAYEDMYGIMPCKYISPNCGNEESLYFGMGCVKELEGICNFYCPIDFISIGVNPEGKAYEIKAYARILKKK